MKIRSLIVTAVLATAFLCSGVFVKAETIDNSALIAQLQAQITSLTAQVAALQGQTTTTTAWCHTFTNYLVAGSTDTTTNGEVTYLQTALTKEGYEVSSDTAGTFDDATAVAVVSFQGKYGITQTGTVGPKTRAELNTLYGCSTTTTTTPSITVTSPNGGGRLGKLAQHIISLGRLVGWTR